MTKKSLKYSVVHGKCDAFCFIFDQSGPHFDRARKLKRLASFVNKTVFVIISVEHMIFLIFLD